MRIQVKGLCTEFLGPGFSGQPLLKSCLGHSRGDGIIRAKTAPAFC